MSCLVSQRFHFFNCKVASSEGLYVLCQFCNMASRVSPWLGPDHHDDSGGRCFCLCFQGDALPPAGGSHIRSPHSCFIPSIRAATSVIQRKTQPFPGHRSEGRPSCMHRAIVQVRQGRDHVQGTGRRKGVPQPIFLNSDLLHSCLLYSSSA